MPGSAPEKIFYRPIEAAIRWSNLFDHEHHIIQVLGAHQVPAPTDFPQWPRLHLNTARILDALTNRDLPYGKNGVTCEDPLLLDDPDLTVRHVDLKAWMASTYPEEKPGFLFGAIEQHLFTGLSTEAIQILLADREALKIQLADQEHICQALQIKYDALRENYEHQQLSIRRGKSPSARSESTYLNIVAGLLSLLLGHSPSGQPYSSFKSQDAVISAMIAHSPNTMGITERTLQAKFAEAKRHLASN